MASLIPRPVLRLLSPLRSTASLHTAGFNGCHPHEDVSHAGDRDPLTDNRGSFTTLEATAVACALHRARETERRQPRLHDPYARRLVEAAESTAGCTSSNALSSSVRINHRRWHAGIVVRTNVFDQIIRRLVRDQHARLVLNLAAGYDTRPYRLDLPASVQWIEADTRYLLAIKAAVLHHSRPHCVVERIPVDLTDAGDRRRLLSHIDRERYQSERRGVVVTEGLLAYLRPEQVEALAANLHAVRSLRWWVLDLGSPRAAAQPDHTFKRIPARVPHQADSMLRPGASLEAGSHTDLSAGLATSGTAAAQLFCPDDGSTFFTRFGWRVSEEYSFVEEAHRLRAISPWVWWAYQTVCRVGSAVQRDLLREMARFIVLERTEVSDAPGQSCDQREQVPAPMRWHQPSTLCARP